MDQPHLPGIEPPPAPDPDPDLSPGRRRTERQREMLAAGVHPATGAHLLDVPTGVTCGECAHLVPRRLSGRTVFKCDLAGTSRSEATDVRLGWPACAWFVDGE